ncbi:sugar O-acetyltransferase [Albibacterium indicum]|uniref:sugar O-acetyltransferase n=1 Tax=Albibacterium indicum TaxID=2292082 RepID=UPI000E48C40A|nr:sugar O-acetyltransferase [Pedobacter indicus]
MKTEKEKMLSGEVYSPYVADLTEDRARLKDLIHQYNLLAPSETDAKQALARTILGSAKENFTIEQPFYCDYGYNIHIGNNFFSNFNCTILDVGLVTIGDDVLLGPNVSLFTVNHVQDPQGRKDGLEYAKPIVIGNNVWVGGNVVILPGITIGDNSIIGAGSVVTKNIPANVIAVGNPCKVVKEI